MAAKSLQDLFVEELRDAYDAEKRLIKALSKMARAADSPQLKTAFTTHGRETERQVTRLEQVFRSIGEPVRGKKCDGIIGIIEEGNSAMEEMEGSLLDAALIAGAQRAEHYEIAAYGTLAYFAELLGHQRAKDLLGETLDEEKAADEKLTQVAKSDVNRQALAGIGNERDEDESGSRSSKRRSSGRGGAKRSTSRKSARR
jgi:ferritin-like metal-binding protein YciE